MQVKLRKPNIQILLHKVVTRTSAAGNTSAASGSGAPSSFSSGATTSGTQVQSTNNVFDVTSHLGEGSIVRVQKSVRDSAGAFSITFVDNFIKLTSDTAYSFFEPMDMVEIRFAADSYQYAGPKGQQLPIMMRGFVSDVERGQVMGADGKPHHGLTVTGHDYHKILQILQIFNMPATPEVANAISSLPLYSKYGADLNVQTTTQFLLQVFNLIVNPYIANMQAAGATSGTALAQIATDIQVPDALMSVQLGAFNSGTVQQLLEEYLDLGPFNEFFIEDRDAGAWGPAGPYAVYRPAPFLGAVSRAPLQPIQDSVTTGVSADSQLSPTANLVSITTDSVISVSQRRSDAGVANYYWVDAPRFAQNYDDLTKMYATYAAQQGVVPYYIQNYQNVNPALYGLRKMEVMTQQGDSTETNAGNGTPAGEARFKNQSSFLSWIDDRRNLLIALNQDNVVFEHGSLHLAGNERIRAGSYVKVRFGATPGNPKGLIQSLYYAHSVTHVYEPFGNYFTEVDYDRGTNFIDRTTQGAGNVSPYFAEMISWSNSQ